MFLIRSFLRHVGLANYTGPRSILWTYRLSPSVCSQLGACIAISLQTVCGNACATHIMLVASIKNFVFYSIKLIIVTAVTACFLRQFCGVLFSCPVPPPFPHLFPPSVCACCDSPLHQPPLHKPGLLFTPVPGCSISTSVSPALSQVSYLAFLISDVTFSCLCFTLFCAWLHWLHLLTLHLPGNPFNCAPPHFTCLPSSSSCCFIGCIVVLFLDLSWPLIFNILSFHISSVLLFYPHYDFACFHVACLLYALTYFRLSGSNTWKTWRSTLFFYHINFSGRWFRTVFVQLEDFVQILFWHKEVKRHKRSSSSTFDIFWGDEVHVRALHLTFSVLPFLRKTVFL